MTTQEVNGISTCAQAKSRLQKISKRNTLVNPHYKPDSPRCPRKKRQHHTTKENPERLPALTSEAIKPTKENRRSRNRGPSRPHRGEKHEKSLSEEVWKGGKIAAKKLGAPMSRMKGKETNGGGKIGETSGEISVHEKANPRRFEKMFFRTDRLKSLGC